MSELMVIVFSSHAAADEARKMLTILQHNTRAEPEDIIVVTRKGAGQITLEQTTLRTTGKPLGDGRWGMLIGSLFLDERNPEQKKGKGLAVLFGKTGLDADFIRNVSKALVNGGAAVGMRRRALSAKAIKDELAKLAEPGRIISTLLSTEVEENLVAMHDQIPDVLSLNAG